jgi:hypothetical protein
MLGCAPALLDLVERLSMLITDVAAAAVRSPSPFPLTGADPCGLVNAWTDEADRVVAVLVDAGFTVAAWPAEESVPTTYGDNPHSEPRDWPDGEPSRGIVAVTFLERPSRLDREEWLQRWHGRISPVTERIQPRTRYVRNLLGEALTPDAPPWEGLVEEAFPSPRHVTNPLLFYGASGPIELLRHVGAVLGAVMSALTLWRIRTVMMTEYFLRT